MRAGGKHNDLENVGFTRRHHTFFEMLGNFSFGDYFKRDAIRYAWELLTSPEWFGIDPAKLYVTVFAGDEAVLRDDEAEGFWREVGVPKERIFAMGVKDNFWAMGDTGPCGPCSEIFYDLGVEASETGEDRPFPEDDQRYVEVWNLVFMQFDRSSDGVLTPLPKPSIDTGMGLERIAAVLQGKLSNYETDLFTPLIARAAELTEFSLKSDEQRAVSNERDEASLQVGADHARAAEVAGFSLSGYELGAVSSERDEASLRIIADHARAATFLISDGVLPANEGRGYVLRKIMRRGIRHGRLLGQERPFMHEMVFAVRDVMGVAYPELRETAERVSKTVLAEEEQFARVIAEGSKRWDDLIGNKKIDAWMRQEAFLRELAKDKPSVAELYITEEKTEHWTMISSQYEAAESVIRSQYGPVLGETIVQQWLTLRGEPIAVVGGEAFRLYETYGLPLDFMVDAARDAGIGFDMPGFERAKEEEQARARASWKGGSQKSAAPVYRELAKTEFEGYYVDCGWMGRG